MDVWLCDVVGGGGGGGLLIVVEMWYLFRFEMNLFVCGVCCVSVPAL